MISGVGAVMDLSNLFGSLMFSTLKSPAVVFQGFFVLSAFLKLFRVVVQAVGTK